MELILHSDLTIKDAVLVDDVKIESNWIYSQELLDQYAANGELYVTQDLYFRRIVTEPRIKKLKDILPMAGADGVTGFRFMLSDNLFADGWGTNEDGFDELHGLFGAQNVFNFPKPTKLISKLILSATRDDNDALILDFFAGSGTTAHALWELNVKDSGTRRTILIQLPEPLDPAIDVQKTTAEYCDKIGKPRTIAEITKERLRRAGKKIREENPTFNGDLGFRVFKLASSNIRAWEPDRDDLPKTLEESVEHLKTDRTEEDILFELLLKLGLDLTVPIEQKTIVDKTVHSVGAGTLIVCLDEKIGTKQVEPLALGIAEWHKTLAPAGESTVVFRDSAFADDVAKTNLTAILQQHGLENVKSL
jgi:adenine-specific DNA-methyltransferase